ncbi:MAG: glycine cleavage system aminomethyltransferase GcvT, partial [Candidatus Neomarinimicrobiota bacterium]|nr:glycine cleavage system aminomethyltransferase GcvT [Candidatus Neomarinimicrobiota bacterium]
GKMVDFAGFRMPIQYSSIIEEHNAVRSGVGLFDLSHMGEFVVSGDEAVPFLQRMTTNDISQVEVGQAQYTAICNERGGIIDDCVVYRFEDHFLLVVNASNIEKDFDWFERHLSDKVSITDRSKDYCLIAVQGPRSLELLLKATDKSKEAVESLPFYCHCTVTIEGLDVICARTGYTGELGYELYLDGGGADRIWSALSDQDMDCQAQPVGLGARDTLRLEMKYCLYGNDIDEETNPLEAGLGWITKLDKGDFIGGEALREIKSKGLERKLIGFQISGRGIARHGCEVIADGTTVGHVTSGTHSPSLEKSIGMAYVETGYSFVGSKLTIDSRRRQLEATVVKTPFWTKGTAARAV